MAESIERPSVTIVLTTVGSEEKAAEIAKLVVGRRLAACVNILPAVRSIYRWKGVVEDDREHLLLIKTTRTSFAALASAIREVHPYELPELVAIESAEVESRFAAWVVDSTGAGGTGDTRR